MIYLLKALVEGVEGVQREKPGDHPAPGDQL